ncbi:MAG: hypothetical protein AB7U20_04615 [Planctomycetaceae bacterium]
MFARIGCLVAVTTLSATVILGAEVPAEPTVGIEQQARARLVWLRQQVAEQQREIRELEELLDESAQILVRMQLVEVDAAGER